MKIDRSFHPACPPAGTFYIHDDAVWLAGERNTLKVSWIRREPNGWFSVLSSYPEHAPARMACIVDHISTARTKLNLEAKRIQRKAR